jgi:hypothetical protein
MLNAVEEFRQVHIDAMCVSLPDDLLDPLGGSMNGSARAKTEARFRESRIEDRCQNLSDGLLNETIEHVWNTERSFTATVFRDGTYRRTGAGR